MPRSSIAARVQRVRRGNRPILVFLGACAVVAAIGACNLNDNTGPGATSAVAITAGDSQTILAGAHASPFVVKVTSNGVPQSGVTVNWTTSNTKATLDPLTSTTDANGIAQTTYSNTLAGKDTVRASTTTALVSFLVTIVTDTNSRALFAAGGNGSATLVGIGVVLTVKSADAFGNARPGVVVNFASDAGLLSKTTVTTDSSGIATTQFTPGPNTGTYTVHATATNYAPVTFSVSAI